MGYLKVSIESTSFGVTKLTNKDSDKFRKQVAYGRPSVAASNSLAEGKNLLRTLDKHGSVKVKTKNIK